MAVELLYRGRQVSVLDQSASKHSGLPEGCDYISGDFGNHDQICPLLDSHSEIIHLAYATVPNTSFENPLSDLQQNLPPTVQLFTEVAQRGGKLLLVSSGGTVYGEAEELPIKEDHKTRPISPYGVTKLTSEIYAHLFATTNNLKYLCVRPSNAYGEGQKPFTGQGFISTAMASILTGKKVKIFGETGTVRDYIHVSDLAAGIACALESGRLSETYNLGSGRGYSNLEILEIMASIMKIDPDKIAIEHLPKRFFDVQTNILDSTKLMTHTGWTPKVNFLEGLVKTHIWLSSRNA